MGSTRQRVNFQTGFNDLHDLNPTFAIAKMRIAYVGDNRNGSSISKEVLENAIPTMFNCPIVAHYDRATNTFGSHDVELVLKDNNAKLINITQPVGVVPAGAEYFFETDIDANGVSHEYLSTTAILWKRQEAYAHICELQSVDESMECVFESSHLDDRGYLVADSIYFEAFCLLESAQPCYEGAQVALFNEENELTFKQQYAQMMSELAQYAVNGDAVTAQKSQEGGEQMSLNDTLIAEILAEFDLTVEDLNFEITEDMTADQLRERASAFVAESADPEPEEPEDETPAEAEGEEPEDAAADSGEATEPVGDPEPEAGASDQSFAVTYNERREILRQALQPVITDTTETYLYLMDFDDDYVFVERDTWGRNDGSFVEEHGRIAYVLNEDENAVTFTSEFELMIMTWLTQEEHDALEQRRALLDDLIAFQENTLLKEYKDGLESVFEIFKDLEGTDDFEEYCTQVRSLAEDKENRPSLDVVREHCYALRGKRGQTFNQKLESKDVVRVSLPHAAPAADDDGVGRLFAKHIHR